MGALVGSDALALEPQPSLNVAKVAMATSMTARSENNIATLNDGFDPVDSFDRSHGTYIVHGGREEAVGRSWVQYDWSAPVTINRTAIYWAAEKPKTSAAPGGSASQATAMPAGCRLLYWNGTTFVPVDNATGLGVDANKFNVTDFTPVKTTKLRLEVTVAGKQPAGIVEWKVFSYGPEPHLEPVLYAGVDRSVVTGAATYLSGKVTWLKDSASNQARWSKLSGPGTVEFRDSAAPVTRASFSVAGDYVLGLTATEHDGQPLPVAVHVETAPPRDRLDVVYTRHYAIDSPLWNQRAKMLITNWIPHCIRMCERTDIPAGQGDGGIDNFIEAGKANRGKAHGRHKGLVFSNAWVHQTVESMCIALMIDAQGDVEVAQAQTLMRGTLDRWIPIILAAQMEDGYLQTAYTLADRDTWPERWSPSHRGNHEGYVVGYFIESAINHYTLTDGQDLRLYNAAKKLADCWVANIGPGKRAWFDGHQEMEQALVRFGRFVNDQEGQQRGDAYIALAKFLLDSRQGGSQYDQSHLPPGQQYEAVGHAVRAVYFYSGMADIAAETHDPDYQSAVISLWDNMVNRKYYITGGVGSGETSEGFGPNYSLRQKAYCETCSSCGLVFFQYKLNLAYHDAKYADLYEQTFYNALLGGVALDGKSFCYTNPLVNTERAKWHTCPCCVGNLARTLLMIPTWSYAKSADGLYVNMYVGSRIHVGNVAGTPVEMVQKTNYPWQGAVALEINPDKPTAFALHLRVPDRTTSKLYRTAPEVRGLRKLLVNGVRYEAQIVKGYAVIAREWRKGDRVEIELAMEPQRITADEHIAADRNLTAIAYGPLVYNVEKQDNGSIERKLSDAPLLTEWRPDLLGGVLAITGKWKDGSTMTAIPNYARMNRTGEPNEYPGHREASSSTEVVSKVWI
jgi:DUF1680 family protein